MTPSKTQASWNNKKTRDFQAILESKQIVHARNPSYNDQERNYTEPLQAQETSSTHNHSVPPTKGRFEQHNEKPRINYQKGGGGGAFKRKLVLAVAQSQSAENSYQPKTLQATPVSAVKNIDDNQEIEHTPTASCVEPKRELDCSPLNSQNVTLPDNSKSIKNGNAWQRVMNDGNFNIPKTSNSNGPLQNSTKINPLSSASPIPKKSASIKPKNPISENQKLQDAININPIEIRQKQENLTSDLEKPRSICNPSSAMHEMKKQILQELMEINNIPASYFLLGKEATKCRLDIGIDDVAGLVDISTNEEGDIVIRPNEASIAAQYSKSRRIQANPESEANSCKNAVTIRRVQINKKPGETARRKLFTAETPIRSTQRKKLTPIKRAAPIKPTSEQHPVANTPQQNSNKFANLAHVPSSSNSTSPDIKRTSIASKHAATPISKSGVPIQKESPPKTKKTEIKIWHESDNHLIGHHINVTFKLINEMLGVCNKLKLENTIDKQQQFMNLSRKLNLNFTKKQISNPDFFKAKENITNVKDKLLRVLYNMLNKDNEYTNDQKTSGYQKYFVGNGNNPMLVKSVLKQRWWWALADSIDTANLVWTQWKKPRIMAMMPCIRPCPNAVPDKEQLTTSTSMSTDVGFEQELKETQKKKLNTSNNTKVTNVQYDPPNPFQKTILRLCNHLEGNGHLGNKKAMFYNLKIYYESIGKDPFIAMPLTFHIKEGKTDKEYQKFLDAYHNFEEQGKNPNNGHPVENVWIIKPGENSNRGHGIALAKTLVEIEKIMSEPTIKGEKHTYILQKYIERPLLFNKRKFDIRCYGLLTAINGHVKGYFYKEGYLRTASKDFSLKTINSKIVHLTNEAVQIKYDEFGKFEPGNKLTYADLQKYIEANYPDIQVNFYTDLLPQIKKLVTDSYRATHGKLDPMGRQYTFELFGFDFMIDADFHVWLIEANINPCLEITSPVTARIVPLMVDNAIRLGVDPIFQPPSDLSSTKKTTGEILPEIKHELVYDSKVDANELLELKKMSGDAGNVIVEVEDEENIESGDEAPPPETTET